LQIFSASIGPFPWPGVKIINFVTKFFQIWRDFETIKTHKIFGMVDFSPS
jgi:hypothetical protein